MPCFQNGNIDIEFVITCGILRSICISCMKFQIIAQWQNMILQPPSPIRGHADFVILIR